MQRLSLIALLWLGITTGARAATLCGTVSQSLTCSGITDGQIQFTFSDFLLRSSTSSGGGTQYVGGDFIITANFNPGGTAQLQLTRNGGGPFLSNAGEISNFAVSFDVTIAPAAPGTVAFVESVVADMQESVTANGNGTMQAILPGAPICNLTFATQNRTCPTTSGLTNILNDYAFRVSLIGNSGSVALSSTSMTFAATFTPDSAPSSDAPEPVTASLLTAGLAFLVWRKHKN